MLAINVSIPNMHLILLQLHVYTSTIDDLPTYNQQSILATPVANVYATEQSDAHLLSSSFS